MARFLNRVWRMSAFQTGPTKGFVGAHPEWFNPQPNLLEITDLRVAFEIKKNLLTKDPNTAEVVVSNCSETTRSLLCTTPLVVRLEAGHIEDSGPRHLFTGNLQFGSSSQAGGTWNTKLLLGDGAAAFNGARVNKTFKRGASALQALREVVATMGLELPQSVQVSPELTRQFATGVSLYGQASDELTRLLAPFGYFWSIQDGRLVVLRDEDHSPGTALPISGETGLIGSPEYATPSSDDLKKGKPRKLTFKTLLYPQITPGGLLDVQTARIDGIFRAGNVVHKGDSHSSSEWTTTVECTPMPNASRRL